MKRSEIFFGILRLPLDFFIVFSSLLFSYLFRANNDDFLGFFHFNPIDDIPSLFEFQKFAFSASFLFILVAAYHRLYLIKTSSNRQKEFFESSVAGVVWTMFLISYFFVIREFFFSRFVLIFASILVIILVPIGRMVVRSLQTMSLNMGFGVRQAVILGTGKTSKELFQALGKDKRFNVIGLLSEEFKESKKNSPKILGTFQDLEKIAKKLKIEEVFQTKDTKKTSIIEICKNLHLKYYYVPNVFEIQRTNISVESFAGIPIVELLPTPLEGWNRVIKRLFDVLFSLLVLILLSPLLLIVSILIKLDSSGPVFFSKLPNGKPALRIGQKGRPFRLYKFRTMKKDSHDQLKTLIKDKNLRKEGPLYKIKDDPRITKLGRFLRMSSIDELPNLFSVLRGEMSIVGPRPHTPEEVSKYGEQNKRVLEIKPGITGLAQVSGRHNLKFNEENKLDLFYIENWSLRLDIKIIIKTFSVIFSDVLNMRKN